MKEGKEECVLSVVVIERKKKRVLGQSVLRKAQKWGVRPTGADTVDADHALVYSRSKGRLVCHR